MTIEQIEKLNLGIVPIDSKTAIAIESAIDWIKQNTIIDCEDLDNLPPCAKLFISEFVEVANLNIGIASESIEGLSQSFKTSDKSVMIWDLANSYLSNYLNSVRFVTATRRWA